MLLANGINLPLVVLGGVLTFGPLTLLVTTLEALTFRLMGRTGFRRAFGPVLVANLLSTAAGGLLYCFQGQILDLTGIRTSIPAFVRGYAWVGAMLVGLYWAKSVLVEGAWLSRRASRLRAAVSRGRILATTVVGNVATYAIVGPLFIYATRPNFSGLETTFDAKWSANRDVVVYFLAREDHSIRRARLDGSEERVISTYPAREFMISGDESRVLFAGDEGAIYLAGAGLSEPLRVTQCADRFYMRGFGLSADGNRVAFRISPTSDWSSASSPRSIQVFDATTRTAREIARITSPDDGTIAWSADGESVFVEAGQSTSIVFRLDPHQFNDSPEQLREAPDLNLLAENYLCRDAKTYPDGWRIHEWYEKPRSPSGLTLSYTPFIGSHVSVHRDVELLLSVRNEYGLLNLGRPWIQMARFLPANDEILIDWWQQVYVLDVHRRRLGLAIDGENPVLRTPDFRARFDTTN